MRLERRGFLTLLGAGTLGAALPYPVLGQPAPPPTSPLIRRIELDSFFVAGVQHHDAMRPDVAARLVEGLPLHLVREPGNPYDSGAIAIHLPTDGRLSGPPALGPRIGYVPRRYNEVPGRLMKQGARIEAELDYVDPDAPPWERVSMRIWLYAEAASPTPPLYATSESGLLVVPAPAPADPPLDPQARLVIGENGTLTWMPHDSDDPYRPYVPPMPPARTPLCRAARSTRLGETGRHFKRTPALPPPPPMFIPDKADSSGTLALELHDVRQRLDETWDSARALDDALDAALHETAGDAEAIARLPVRAAHETGHDIARTVTGAADDLRTALVGAATVR